MSEKVKRTGKFVVVLGVILALVLIYSYSPVVKAGDLNHQKVTISDSRPSVTAEYVFAQDFATTGTAVKCLQVDFCSSISSCGTPTGMNLASDTLTKGTSGNWGAPFTYSAWGTPSAVDANTLQLTNSTGENPNNTTDNKFAVGGITNPSSAGTVYVKVTAYSNSDCSGEIDSGFAAVAILSGVSVSASIGETLSFSFDDSSIGFGSWNTTEVRYATGNEQGATSDPGNGEATTASLSTNAAYGAVVTMHDTNDGMDSADDTIPTYPCNQVSSGNARYCIYTANASGVSLDSDFSGENSIGEMNTSPQDIVTVSGPVSNGSWDIRGKAAISSTTKPGSYSDTLIFIATPTY